MSIGAVGCDNNDELDGGVIPGVDMAVASDLAGTVNPTSQVLTQTNLTSDQTDAAHQDANLVNAWGLAFNPAGPIWISANGTGTAVVVDQNGTPTGLVVTIPPPPSTPTATAAPTGQVFDATGAFMGDRFIFATEDGTIAAWQSGTTASLRVDRSGANAVFKGITLLAQNGVSRLYATDFHNAQVIVFDTNYQIVQLAAGAFTDPNIPAGFAPFNVQAIGTQLYVSYAKQNAEKHDDVKGLGNGFVDVYDFDGVFVRRFATQGVLDSPWGMVQAPADFGALSGMILIGNFGDGRIHAFNPQTGIQGAAINGPNGSPLTIDGLWALGFMGNTLFFTAGPADETHGLFGRLNLQ